MVLEEYILFTHLILVTKRGTLIVARGRGGGELGGNRDGFFTYSPGV